MLRWRKTSSLLDRAFLIDHVSHPHRRRFIGIAQKEEVFAPDFQMRTVPDIAERSH
jgi:hypothetical protein